MTPVELQQYLGRQTRLINALGAQVGALKGAVDALKVDRVRSIEEQLDAIEGRRIEYRLSGRVTFDITDLGTRGEPINFQVSQDGPFVMTHYPMALWKPSAPSTATNLGRWRPVCSGPLPTQQVTTDFIDISYELVDGGSQRNFQNEPSLPVLSRPDDMVPCPKPTLFAPNSNIQFFPTYEDILFDGAVAPTSGILVVSLLGYRIVNL